MAQNIPNSYELDVDSTENNFNRASFEIPMIGKEMYCAGSDITETAESEKEERNGNGFEDEHDGSETETKYFVTKVYQRGSSNAEDENLIQSESANNNDHTPNLHGKKGKINKLHWVIVMVSLVLFVVITSLFYGHSFKRIDKEHYKAVFALATSLFCIISLSYAFKMDKLKTVAKYTAMAIGAFAISFIASQLVSLPLITKKDDF